MTPSKIRMRDVPASRRLGADIRFLLTEKSVGARSGFLGTMTLEPGEYVSAHYHPYSDEFVFLAEGSLRMRVDGEDFLVERHEAVLVPKGAHHRYENVGDSTAFLVFQVAPLAPSPEEGHVEVEPVPQPSAQPPSVGS
ncbi:cupin domain-containing protein [Streptomyces sp. NBC_01239]|uniref:cupin domain-containing protein n=1 Tax=Streptomyces sp. NBC_01239 TaxID=2903792 RepID=UPI00225808DB|nr:cupin domain-containing protein [Streptomyces sp. NBC_01239]MCX4816349.1 cupin domain-containing protein [Streptomyces sp. NBC_01239]